MHSIFRTSLVLHDASFHRSHRNVTSHIIANRAVRNLACVFFLQAFPCLSKVTLKLLISHVKNTDTLGLLTIFADNIQMEVKERVIGLFKNELGRVQSN